MTKGLNSFLFLISIIAGFGGFLFGYDSSVVADVEDQVIKQLSLSDWQWSQIVSISLLGCVFGIPISGFISDRLSRRFLLKVVALGFIFGTGLCALATNLTVLIAGRFIIGVCIGIASFIVPLFIAEIAPPENRGALVLLNGVAITFGQALAFLIGYYLHDYSSMSWRYLFWIGCIPAFIMFMGMFFVPHSPRWIMKKYGIDHTLKLLRKIRPINYDVYKEINEINSILKRPKEDYRSLFRRPVLGVLLVGSGIGIFQQASGISAFMYYGPVIFGSIGFSPVKNAILATFLLGLINFAFTVITLLYVDKLGRRFLLLSGTLLAAMSLFLVSFLFSGAIFVNKYMILLAFSVYIMGYCVSVGSLFWVLISEIYPLQVRGFAMSIATVMQWAANFIVSLYFIGIYQNMGQSFTFSLFGSSCLLACVFVYYFVPETTGVSLEVIESNLNAGLKIRTIGKPLKDEELQQKDFEPLMD
ncbi:sugar porter family MFS transporter [Legionella waltersii]|uniref:Sugar-proton symporter n=1 Tax=Legionella waltersii TaxID=66969 RepID=A0A0W1A1I7_9GAMM|nr:sugar porter family MFS transporter [Legionella waltersii]KTD75142.1 sugar-proton symporter [Legionella waltersii]SNV04847.1 sugar-proton symporter [Legionella waltersii]